MTHRWERNGVGDATHISVVCHARAANANAYTLSKYILIVNTHCVHSICVINWTQSREPFIFSRRDHDTLCGYLTVHVASGCFMHKSAHHCSSPSQLSYTAATQTPYAPNPYIQFVSNTKSKLKLKIKFSLFRCVRVERIAAVSALNASMVVACVAIIYFKRRAYAHQITTKNSTTTGRTSVHHL